MSSRAPTDSSSPHSSRFTAVRSQPEKQVQTPGESERFDVVSIEITMWHILQEHQTTTRFVGTPFGGVADLDYWRQKDRGSR